MFFATLQATNEVEGNYFWTDAKRKILIVSFLNYIQEKNCGKAEKYRSSRGYKILMGFALWPGSGRCGLPSPKYIPITRLCRWQNSPAFRLCTGNSTRLNPIKKLRPRLGFSISCISLPSHVFFLNLVKENYNIEPSLSIHILKNIFLQLHVLWRTLGGLRIRKWGGYGEWTRGGYGY